MGIHATEMESNEDVPNSQQGSRQGKRRIMIERQPTDKKRNATFLNRRAGLLKKARERASLCGVDETLIVFSSQGELYEFSSNTNAHILHQYLVKKQEEEGHTVDQELVALYYKLAHVEALEHEANRSKYNLELHRVKIDPWLRKFTVNELQIMSERNLLNKFEHVLRNNQKAILEYYEKIQYEDFVPNDQQPQVQQKPIEQYRTSRYAVNEGQYQQFQHQVHMGYHEDVNKLLMATIERERDLLRCGESSLREMRVVGRGGSSQRDIEQRMHHIEVVAPQFANAQGSQQCIPNNQNMHMSYPNQTWLYKKTRMNFGQDSRGQHATAMQPSLEQPKTFYQPPVDVELDQGKDSGVQRLQACVTNFQNTYPSNPNQAQDTNEFLICGDFSTQVLEDFYSI